MKQKKIMKAEERCNEPSSTVLEFPEQVSVPPNFVYLLPLSHSHHWSVNLSEMEKNYILLIITTET